MKKLLLIAFITILYSSCQTDSNKNSSIKTFQSIIGSQNTQILNELVADLDKYIYSEFHGKDMTFKKFLSDIKNKDEAWMLDSATLVQCIQSNLLPKYDSIYPDSVWFDGKSFNLKFTNQDSPDEIRYVPKIRNSVDVDSIVNALAIKPKLLLKQKSIFVVALDSVQKSDSLISDYLLAKKIMEIIPSDLLSEALLYRLNDDNQYFAKRIFIMNNLIE